jgi:His-Xaa-Ser system protein HxsD
MSPTDGVPGADAEAMSPDATQPSEIMLAFDQATVELDALQRGAYAVAAEMTVDIRASGADYVCTLFPRKRDFTDDEIKHRFRAEVNDQILRVRIGKETEPLRNLVFALAFSKTGLIGAEETVE